MTALLIKNARVFAPQDLGKNDVLMVNDRIVAVGQNLAPQLPDLEILDASGKILTPGFSFDAPQRTTLPEMTWLSAVMSVRSKSAANSGGSRRAAAGKRRKGRVPKKGLHSRIRSCAIMRVGTKRD